MRADHARRRVDPGRERLERTTGPDHHDDQRRGVHAQRGQRDRVVRHLDRDLTTERRGAAGAERHRERGDGDDPPVVGGSGADWNAKTAPPAPHRAGPSRPRGRSPIACRPPRRSRRSSARQSTSPSLAGSPFASGRARGRRRRRRGGRGRDRVGVDDAVAVAVAVGVGEAVGERVGVAVTVGVGVVVADAVTVAVGVGVGDRVAVAVAVAVTVTRIGGTSAGM